MQVKDIMTPGVECIRPDDTLQNAARKMRDLDVGPLPVCGDNDRLAGMITDRDIVVRAIADGKDPKATKVREAMTDEIIYCFEDQDVQEAARTMQERQVRRLVVLNRDKRLVGIVSLAHRTGGPRALRELAARTGMWPPRTEHHGES
jgi:CBS domain-containing protein